MNATRTAAAARVGFIALIAGATGIGFAPILVRMSEVGPSATAFFRLLIALPLLWCWMHLDRRNSAASPRQPATRRDFLLLATAGLFFTGDLSIWHWSLQFTTVTNSTLLTNVAPIFVTIGARFMFAERITTSFVLGMALALVGAGMLVGTSYRLSTEHLWGDFLSIVAALFYAGYLLTLKQLRQNFTTPTIMAWSGLVSCAGFGIVAWLSRETMWPPSTKAWWVVAGLALVCHLGGQTLIAYGFGHLPASFSSVSLLWQPVVAALAAWAFLGERLGWLQTLGAVIVLAGIALASGAVKRPAQRNLRTD